MLPFGSIVLGLIQNVSLIALVVVGYEAIRRRAHLSELWGNAVIGLVFGVGVLLAMSLPVLVAPGIFIDGRSVLIGGVAISGGPLATAITVAIGVAYRLWLGGEGAATAAAGIVCSGIVGLICFVLIRRKMVPADLLTFFILGIAVVTAGLAPFFLLNWEVATQIGGSVALPLYIVGPVGMILIGVMLRREDARLALQEKLARETRLLEVVFNSMSEGVAVVGLQGQVVLANPVAARLAGFKVDDKAPADGDGTFERFEADGETPFPTEKLPLRLARLGEATDNVELVARNPDTSEKRWLYVSARPLLDASGQPRGGVAVFRDVTEQRRMEQILRSSEERFALAVAGSKDGIFDYKPVSGEIWFSPRYKEILGYDDADFPNDVVFWKSLMLAEDYTATRRQYFDYETGILPAVDILQRFRHKNGSLVYVQSRSLGVRDEKERVVRVVGAITDITPLIRSETRLKEAIDAMESGFALFDADDRLIICNDGFLDAGTWATLGTPIGLTFEEVFSAIAYGDLTAVDAMADRQGWLKRRLELHRNPPVKPLEVMLTNGRWLRVTERRTAEGGYVGVWTDITTVKASEARLRDAIDSIQEGFALFDWDMRFVIFNQRFVDTYPLSAPAIVAGARMEDVLRYGAERGEYPDVDTPERIDAFVRQWDQRFRSSEPYLGESAFRDGRWVLVSQHSMQTGGYVGVRTDITLLKHREQALQLQQDLLQSITEAMPVMTCFIDTQRCYRYCNRAYLSYIATLDRKSGDFLGHTMKEVFGAESYAVFAGNVDAALLGQASSFERPLFGPSRRFVEGRYIPRFGIDGQVDGFYIVMWDITERRAKERRLIEQATTDELTGLINRGQFMELLYDEIRRQMRYGRPIAVMYLDIDNFKSINDSLGHAAGDTVLAAIAERLRRNTRGADHVARFGGDEFVILLVAPRNKADVEMIAGKLVEAARQGIRVNGKELVLSLSIGVAYAEHSIPSAEKMLQLADEALYAAKEAGRDTYRLQVLGDQPGVL
ncbi:MAG: diguanylate cyclase [Dongiaceae bacterium]